MKNCFVTLSMTALISITPLAQAASSTDLSLTGTITPSACTPALSGGGVVDYGKIAAKDLNQSSNTLLEEREVTLSVACDAPVKFALQGIDNRSGSSGSSAMFGLGKINGTQNLGRYMLVMNSAVADGVPAQPIKSKDGQSDWHGHLFWMPGDFASVAAMDNFSQPISVQNLNLELILDTYIFRADGLDLSNEVNIDGSATLEMKYL